MHQSVLEIYMYMYSYIHMLYIYACDKLKEIKEKDK